MHSTLNLAEEFRECITFEAVLSRVLQLNVNNIYQMFGRYFIPLQNSYVDTLLNS
jgi:hypothetical protein